MNHNRRATGGQAAIAVIVLAVVLVLLFFAGRAEAATPPDDCPLTPGTQLIVPPGTVVRPQPGVHPVQGCPPAAAEECERGGLTLPEWCGEERQGPTVDGYGGTPARANPDNPAGGLPFTGLDVGLLVFSGFLLLVLGLLTRLRRAR